MSKMALKRKQELTDGVMTSDCFIIRNESCSKIICLTLEEVKNLKELINKADL